MDYDALLKRIEDLKLKHNLTDFHFDTECIYDLGDLSTLLKSVISSTISDAGIAITEEYSNDGKRFVATLSNQLNSFQVFADTDTDWLPDDFFEKLESIPVIFESDLKYYSINPAIGLTGQDAWYFCGTEKNLKEARKEGIPLIFPGEDITETDEFREYNNL